MDGRHLRDDNSPGCAHLLCENRRFWHLSPLLYALPALALAPVLHRGEEGADADACRAQRGTLVNFEEGMHFIGTVEQLGHLVRADGVNAAAEGGQLHEFEFLVFRDHPGGTVETGREAPLVHDAQIDVLAARHPGHAVLRKHGRSQRRDELGDAVVDQGIHVIGAAADDNADAVLFVKQIHDAPAFLVQGRAVGVLGRMGFQNGPADFAAGDAELVRELPGQGFVIKGVHEGRVHPAAGGPDVLVVEAHHLRIAAGYGTAVTVHGVLVLDALAGDAREENLGHALADEPGNVAVGELCGVAYGL